MIFLRSSPILYLGASHTPRYVFHAHSIISCVKYCRNKIECILACASMRPRLRIIWKGIFSTFFRKQELCDDFFLIGIWASIFAKRRNKFPLNSNIYSSARTRSGISLDAQILVLVYLKTFPFCTACSNEILFDYFFLAGMRAPISRNKKYASDK